MPNPYTPNNWYWVVADSTTQVFSSMLGDYVLVSDPAYVAWRVLGNVPTSILNEDELGDVLAPFSLRPAHATVLASYKNSQANKITVEALAKVIFFLANDVRALQGLAPVTAQGFKAFLASKL